MNKRFYQLASFFLGFSLASSLWQQRMFLQIGGNLFTLDSFPPWLVGTSILSLLSTLFLLRYYQAKQNKFTLIAATIYTLATMCQGIIFYVIISSRELESYYIPLLLFSLATGMVYGR